VKKIFTLYIAIVLFVINVLCIDNFVEIYAATETVVDTPEEFLTAISENKTNIIVSENITITTSATDTGKMNPLYISGGTTITGQAGVCLTFRCPIQITGANVVFKDIGMHFESSDALGSVPHREIFLAGYKLTLDNVRTYLEGSAGSLGGLGGTEEELLPTVYAGGFEGSSVGTNAYLQIINASSETCFQGIYMSNDAGNDNKVSYAGKATVELCSLVAVRDGIFTQGNSEALINISGTGNLYDTKISGNNKTTVDIDNVYVYRASINNVLKLRITNSAYLQLNSGSVTNVELTSNACLDLNENTSMTIGGNFVGGVKDDNIDTRGVLVLNAEKDLTIDGEISGATFLHIENRNFPADFILDKVYITGLKASEDDIGFEVANSLKDYYELVYSNYGFKAIEILEDIEYPVVSRIEVTDYPTSVSINDIKGSSRIPNQNAPYIMVNWYDEEDNVIDYDIVQEMLLYANDVIIGIKKEYWESSSASEETDWSNTVEFTVKEGEEGKYYFYANDSYDIITGDYVFIFLSDYYDGNLTTVADVKALENVMTTICVNFYESNFPETPTEPEESTTLDEPTEPEESTTSDDPTEPEESTTLDKPTEPEESTTLDKPTEPEEPTTTQNTYPVRTVDLKTKNYIYNGKYRKPKVVAKDNRGNIISANNYIVKYSNNKNVGIATVTITFVNGYKGKITRNFTIKPKTTSLTKLTSKKRQLTIKWKKKSVQISGYEIQYSTNKKFTKKATKSINVSRKTTSRSVKKLKSDKKYYVRIRTYKTIKLNKNKKKLYSGWSKVKQIRIK